MVGAFDMAMKIRPAPARDVAAGVWTIVPQQQDGIIVYLLLLVPDSEHLVGFLEIAVDEFLIALRWVVRKYDMVSLGLRSGISFQVWEDRQVHFSLDNGRTLVSYTTLSAVERKCDKSGDCKAQWRCAPQARHK